MQDVLNFQNPDWYDENDIDIFHRSVYGSHEHEMAPHSGHPGKQKSGP